MAKKRSHLDLSFRDHGRITVPPLARRFTRRRENLLAHPDHEEDLHRLRIAGKSLRYAMEVFEVCYGKAFHECLTQVENIVEQLGTVHDCDVFIGRLREYQESKPETGVTAVRGIQEIRSELEKKRIRQFRTMYKNLKSFGGKRFHKRLMKSMNGVH